MAKLAPSLRIFCGDFNLDKNTGEFKQFSLSLRQSNLVDANPTSSATYGVIDSNGKPVEWLLTPSVACDKPEVIDHIFADRLPLSSCVLPLRNDDESSRHIFQQVSDHHAVEASFEM